MDQQELNKLSQETIEQLNEILNTHIVDVESERPCCSYGNATNNDNKLGNGSKYSQSSDSESDYEIIEPVTTYNIPSVDGPPQEYLINTFRFRVMYNGITNISLVYNVNLFF